MFPDTIIKNINYIDDLINGRELNFKLDDVQRKHTENIKFISQLKDSD